jgi:hypothetical protein
MQARLMRNAITKGHIARDYLRRVEQTRNSTSSNTPPSGQDAREVLEFFEEHNRLLPLEPVPPVKTLAEVLTRGLRGMTPFMEGCGNGSIGARLCKGCTVKLVGIPERAFCVADIFWDYEEVRIIEPATGIEYVVPWDCLRLAEEQDT